MSDIIDIKPHIKRRKQTSCKHEHVEVDMDAAELECSDCGAPLDPWWYIRREAEREEGRERWYAEQRERYDVWAKNANERAARLQSEIAALMETKNRLANEIVNGQRVGSAVRGRRRL